MVHGTTIHCTFIHYTFNTLYILHIVYGTTIHGTPLNPGL